MNPTNYHRLCSGQLFPTAKMVSSPHSGNPSPTTPPSHIDQLPPPNKPITPSKPKSLTSPSDNLSRQDPSSCIIKSNFPINPKHSEMEMEVDQLAFDFFVREGLPPVLRLRGGGNICKCFKVNDHVDAPGGDVAAGTISYDDIVHITDNFSEDRVIGNGGSAIVYRGTFDGNEVADKVMVIVEGGRIDIRGAYLGETGILRNCDHQNIVGMVAHGIDEALSVAWVVSEFMPNRTLRDRLRGAHDMRIPLSWEIRLIIAIGVARAITYLHNRHPPIVHMDIKSANILLDSNLEPKLADFGVSRAMPAHGYESIISPSIGTAGYADPWFIRYGAVIPDLDIYSFGILVLELISGRGPHPDFLDQVRTLEEEGELIDRVIRPDDGYASFRAHVQLVVDLALSCTAKGERPNAEAVLHSLEVALHSLEAE